MDICKNINMHSTIRNIVFDLGAVIIPIDFQRTFQAFSAISNLSVESLAYKYHSSEFFVEFEKGLIGNYVFIQHLRKLLDLSGNVEEKSIIEAWNKLLFPIPKERIQRIQELGKKYNLYLLSNTNPIHIKEVNTILKKSSGVSFLEDLFIHTYYSYDIGLIKPSTAIYEHVLNTSQLIANETLFLDDNFDNIQSALSIGIQAVHVTESMDMLSILKKY
jgi:putative hydrolase of the HAD superfamily